MSPIERVCLRSLAGTPRAPAIDMQPGDAKTVGRSTQADVVIDEPSLSRLHARVRMGADGAVTVEDLGSMNGVFINGRREQTGTVVRGDRVAFGAVEYQVDGEIPSAQQQTADVTILRMPVAQTSPKVADQVALEALLATSQELMAFIDLQGLLDRVLDRLQPILNPDRSAILLVDGSTGELKPRAVRPAKAYGNVSEFASSTAVREALAAREVLVSYDAQVDARLQQAESVVLAGVRSTICVPLLGRTGPVGALYADQLGTRQFTPVQVQYATAFASHAATALETAKLYEDRERHFRATLEAFAKAIDARDHYTAGHSERVTAYTLVLAKTVGLPAGEIEVIRRAGMLHDIGKVGVPDNILLKAGPLDPTERAAMEAHVTIGYEMLASLPFLVEALPSIRGHHERWDGAGYPDRLRENEVHQHARLMAVADSYDAMTSARPYRTALPVEEATRRLRVDRGKQFDPSAIDAFDSAEGEFRDIQRSWTRSPPQKI